MAKRIPPSQRTSERLADLLREGSAGAPEALNTLDRPTPYSRRRITHRTAPLRRVFGRGGRATSNIRPAQGLAGGTFGTIIARVYSGRPCAPR